MPTSCNKLMALFLESSKFKSKNSAMSYEYKLKKDRVLRHELLMKSTK